MDVTYANVASAHNRTYHNRICNLHIYVQSHLYSYLHVCRLHIQVKGLHIQVDTTYSEIRILGKYKRRVK